MNTQPLILWEHKNIKKNRLSLPESKIVKNKNIRNGKLKLGFRVAAWNGQQEAIFA